LCPPEKTIFRQAAAATLHLYCALKSESEGGMHIRFRRFQEWKRDLKTLRSGNSSLTAASDPFFPEGTEDSCL
jgi:hypothetical protein